MRDDACPCCGEDCGGEPRLNRYQCPCGAEWSDEWCCGCDDECPICRRDVSPEDAEAA